MHSSLAWIEWLDRLERVLQSARSDLAVYSRCASPTRLAALQAAPRQLEALLKQLQWLDPRVLIGEVPQHGDDIIDRLRVVLGTAILRLSRVADADAAGAVQERQKVLATVDTALWDGHYAAAHLIGPSRLSA